VCECETDWLWWWMRRAALYCSLDVQSAAPCSMASSWILVHYCTVTTRDSETDTVRSSTQPASVCCLFPVALFSFEAEIGCEPMSDAASWAGLRWSPGQAACDQKAAAAPADRRMPFTQLQHVD
jgi:hypothetical protein